MIVWRADWSTQLAFWLVDVPIGQDSLSDLTALLHKADLESALRVRFWNRGSLCVRFGFALRSVGVRSGSALADPDQTPKANPKSGLGRFLLGLVRSVL